MLCIRCGKNPRVPRRRICVECIKSEARANAKIYYHKHLEQERERVKRKYHVANPDAGYKISAEEYNDLRTMLAYPGDDADSGRSRKRSRKMTNGDKIRAMSDEELAEYLGKASCPEFNGDCFVSHTQCPAFQELKSCTRVDKSLGCTYMLNWLKQEAKDAD